MPDNFIGEIKAWAPNFAPVDWAFCDGALLPVAQNSTLFALIGAKFGGDGAQNFALPDLRGRVIVGAGQGPGLTNRSLGETGGMESVVLSMDQLPAHTHSFQIPVSANRATTDNPVGNVPAKGDMDLYTTTGSPSQNSVASSATGANQPISVMQPYFVVNYIICINGILPIRS
ncbi:MAG: phage tail protein [Candidatus Omnitrophota bacterium]|jgi:microcystin-dependent protein|nr:MAG: phage tail protein [Candidatus Omnitrophota bacterium]